MLELRPDYIGFILYARSPRYAGELDPQFVSSISGSKKVGVFVNENENTIFRYAAAFNLDLVQLHGDESPELCARMSRSVNVIKAFQVDEDFDFEGLQAYGKSCRYFLFDSKSAGFGGSGISFDHSLLKKYRGATPYFLSGGLSLEHINLNTGAYGLDVNSRFEITPGIKDIKKLKLLKQKLTS